MDNEIITGYEIKKLKKSYLRDNMEVFKKILYQVSYEYWTDEHFLLDLPGKWDYSYVAVLKDALIGFCICSIKNANVLHVHKFFIDKKYRGCGIGQNLLKKVISICITNKIGKISLNTYSINVEALHIYKKLRLSIENVSNDKIGKRYLMTGNIKEIWGKISHKESQNSYRI